MDIKHFNDVLEIILLNMFIAGLFVFPLQRQTLNFSITTDGLMYNHYCLRLPSCLKGRQMEHWSLAKTIVDPGHTAWHFHIGRKVLGVMLL